MINSLPDTIHAHAILDLIRQDREGLTKSALWETLQARYGPAVRFTNCRELTYTFEEILAFLHSREKIMFQGNRILVRPENICEH